MSILINPSIITDGLVGNFDILNPKGRSSDQLTWYNMSRKGNNTILIDNNSYGTPYVLKDTVIDGVKCVAYQQNSTTPSHLRIEQGMTVRTYSFWIKKISNYAGSLLPYFLDLTDSINDAFITSNGFGSYFNSSLCYYNGIYVGNNSFVISDLLYGSLATQWKNIVIIAPTQETLNSTSYLFSDKTLTNGNSTPYAISQLQFYSRSLTMSEIASNYLTFKDRYRL